MIGVIADPSDLATASEFFELFKTPWEPAVPGGKYRAVISTSGCPKTISADVTLIYSSHVDAVDGEAQVSVTELNGPGDVEWFREVVPIYGSIAGFGRSSELGLQSGGKSIEHRHDAGGCRIRRVGYDLFSEVRSLLHEGQPEKQAATPTLELHIDILRHLLVQSNVSFLEIPPRPAEYDFMCCLTHDVDFFGIRRHRFDQTLAGFVARASIGTLFDVCRGRRPVADAVKNWKALASLPFVFSGAVPDFWSPISDYERFEERRPSTFFFVPFRNRPGVAPDGSENPRRAVPYGIADIQDDVRSARYPHEFAVHGIDAWRDTEAGRAEKAEVSSVTGQKAAGVRMHWLYFSKQSGQCLEDAGFDYDSTWGYNEAVGYRAGTSQVFRLSETANLMELPLSIMDSALLFPGRMNLTPDEALNKCRAIVENATRFGGTVVINWHDRSLAPERLWNACYKELLDMIEGGHRAWFATAETAVAWFRWRRSIRITENGAGVAIVSAQPRGVLPGATVRITEPARDGSARVREQVLDGTEALVEFKPRYS